MTWVIGVIVDVAVMVFVAWVVGTLIDAWLTRNNGGRS